MNNLEIDLLQDALFLLMRDKYKMPDTLDKWHEKLAFITQLQQKLDAMRPTNAPHEHIQD